MGLNPNDFSSNVVLQRLVASDLEWDPTSRIKAQLRCAASRLLPVEATRGASWRGQHSGDGFFHRAPLPRLFAERAAVEVAGLGDEAVAVEAPDRMRVVVPDIALGQDVQRDVGGAAFAEGQEAALPDADLHGPQVPGVDVGDDGEAGAAAGAVHFVEADGVHTLTPAHEGARLHDELVLRQRREVHEAGRRVEDQEAQPDECERGERDDEAAERAVDSRSLPCVLRIPRHKDPPRPL